MGVPYVVVPHVGAFMGFRMLIPTGIWPPGARGPREWWGQEEAKMGQDEAKLMPGLAEMRPR